MYCVVFWWNCLMNSCGVVSLQLVQSSMVVRLVSGIKVSRLLNYRLQISSSMLWIKIDSLFCVLLLMFIELWMIIVVIGIVFSMLESRLFMFWVIILWFGEGGGFCGCSFFSVFWLSRVLRLVISVRVIVIIYIDGLCYVFYVGDFSLFSRLLRLLNVGRVICGRVVSCCGVKWVSSRVVMQLSRMVISGLGIQCRFFIW